MLRTGMRHAGLGLLALLLAARLPAAQTDLLAPEQRQWLQRHAPLVWAAEADYQPFIYVEQGRVSGLSHDLLQLLQERLDLPLRRAHEAPLAELLAGVRAGNIDLLTSLRPTPERAEFLAFTSPYIQVPTVLLLRSDQDAQLGLAQLDGRPAAVGQGYAVEGFVRQRYPKVQWRPQPGDREGVAALLRREVDAVVLDLGSASYLLEQFPAHQLQIASRIGFDYPLSLAYRKDWPELGDILERGVRSISLAEREALVRRWLPPLPEARRSGDRFLLVASLLMLLGAGTLLLAYHQRQRTARNSAS